MKHLEDTKGLYEIRIYAASRSIRIFCFFDEGRLVILLNSFVKKTNKTPRKEIEQAIRLKEEYFREKWIGK